MNCLQAPGIDQRVSHLLEMGQPVRTHVFPFLTVLWRKTSKR